MEADKGDEEKGGDGGSAGRAGEVRGGDTKVGSFYTSRLCTSCSGWYGWSEVHEVGSRRTSLMQRLSALNY